MNATSTLTEDDLFEGKAGECGCPHAHPHGPRLGTAGTPPVSRVVGAPASAASVQEQRAIPANAFGAFRPRSLTTLPSNAPRTVGFARPQQREFESRRASQLGEKFDAMGEEKRSDPQNEPTVTELASAPTAVPSTIAPCQPFFKLSVEPEKAVACMNIASIIGKLDKPRKMYDMLYGPYKHPTTGEMIHGPMAKEDQEVFYLIALDTQLYFRGLAEICRGERDMTPAARVDTLHTARVISKEIAKDHWHPTPDDVKHAWHRMALDNAIDRNAMVAVIAHCHPSGRARPSKADKNLTREMELAFAVIGMRLFDHLVCGRNQYFSFYDKGLLLSSKALKRALSKIYKTRNQ